MSFNDGKPAFIEQRIKPPGSLHNVRRIIIGPPVTMRNIAISGALPHETNLLTDATIFYDLEQTPVDQGQSEEVPSWPRNLSGTGGYGDALSSGNFTPLTFYISLATSRRSWITSLLEDPLLVAILKHKRPKPQAPKLPITGVGQGGCGDGSGAFGPS